MRLRTATVSLVSTGALLLTGCGGEETDPAPAAEPSSPTTTETEEPDQDAAEAPEVPGLVVHASDADVETTVSRLEDALGEAGMVVATVDHAAAAASVDLELDPTTLVIGGNPEAGTPIMQAEQEAGLELPQKYLVWESEGTVYLGYNSADWIAEQAGLDDGEASVTDTLRQGSAMVAATGSGNDEPLTTGPTLDDDAEVEEESSDSGAAFAATVRRLEQAFSGAGLSSPATVDHAAGARSIEERLRPTTVTFAGNPEVGTLFMQEAQTMGIDLPLRFLVTQDGDGEVEVSYPAIADLAQRHGATGVDDAIAMVEQAQSMLAAAATESGSESGSGSGSGGDGSEDDRDGDRDRDED